MVVGLCSILTECCCSTSSTSLHFQPSAELGLSSVSGSGSGTGTGTLLSLGTRTSLGFRTWTGTGSGSGSETGLGLSLLSGVGFRLTPTFPSSFHTTGSSKSRTPAISPCRGGSTFPLFVPSTQTLHALELTKPSIHRWPIVKAADDDFEMEEEIEFDDDNDKGEDDEEDLQDFETDYDVIGGRPGGDSERYLESESFISTRGELAESIVDYKINEDEFHKLSLQHCDFFIRKVPDKDNDMYDFREMYVTAPDTDIYAIPRIDGKLPKNPVRFTKSNYEHFCTTEPPVETLRSPMVKNERQVMKIFLMKHFKNRRADAWNFVLDFEQIYVIDSKSRSISRAKVTLNVPGGKDRDRTQEVLLVHDDGTVFTVIPQSKRKTPDDLVRERHWNKTKADLDNYLRSFRDYPISNWF